jgi:transposase InsO family protein
LFGKTRQAFYEQKWRIEKRSMEEELVVKQVLLIRKTLPKLGGRKLHHMLQNFMEQHRINMGRDQLFDLLSEQGLLIKKRKRRVSTTNSNHRFRKYPNMTKGLEINRSEQLWVSDITYLSTRQGFVYLSLITDAYSKKIVGYNVENNLATEGCIKALQMALEGRKQRKRLLIHHSDRGIQYCSSAYVELLQSNSITISMTEKGDPHENAIAERVNGILKDEFNLYQTFSSISHAKSVVKQSVFYYNNHRPHGTCDYLTPQKAEMKEGVLTRRWKNYYRRLNTENE